MMRIEESGGYAKTSDALAASKSSHKRVASAEGAGAMMDYPDTNEHIVRDQKQGVGKIHSKPLKSGHRY